MSKQNINVLKAYRKRRKLNESREPRGKQRGSLSGHRFVIQKHDARQLHYDFRLQIDGVLKSWAIPKGPSLNPATKRLAIPTDDHPLAYAKFEGVIPEGNYGSGTVMVWDIGTYKNMVKKNGRLVSMSKCYSDGHIEIKLKGKKLSGGFVLIKTKRKKENELYWLLVKMNDDNADRRRNPVSSQTKSALSDRTMFQIKRNES